MREGSPSLATDLGSIQILPRVGDGGGRVARLQRGRGPSGLDHRGAPRTAAEPPHILPPQAAPQSEPCYENLELQMCPLREEPMRPRQPEVVYSTLVSTRAQLPAWEDLKVAAGREGSEGLAWWSCASAGQGHTENGASEDFVRADILRRAWCHCGWGVGDEGAIGLAREYGPDSQ